jgi:hypothetical protein
MQKACAALYRACFDLTFTQGFGRFASSTLGWRMPRFQR